MRKYIIFYSLVILVFIAFSQFVYADFESSKIQLFVPEKMIVGEKYHGMITSMLPPTRDGIVEISTNNDFVVQIPQTTKIPINKNHGIFEIKPLHEGEAEIFVSFNGEIASTSTTVFSEKSGAQKLKIILPSNSTIASDLKGFVFLLDGNDSPVNADKDVTVTLVSSEKIFTPTQVVITNGTSNVIFPVTVRASGEITAMTYGLSSDVTTIEKFQQTIDVKMAIAPNIVLSDSYVNYFIWLEKDGKPYSVPHVLKVELQSSNTNSVRLGISPSNNNDILTISMIDGLATGKLYTGSDGMAEIFTSIQNYGHSSSLVYVGSTILSDGDIIEGKPIEKPKTMNPNYIQFWVYPDITSNVAYGVASLYYSDTLDTLEITLDDDGTQITNVVEHTTLIPVKIDDHIISISSEAGLEYDSNYQIDSYNLPTQSKIFEIITKNAGDYIVTATGGNSYDTADLQVTTTHNSEFSILLEPFPIRTETIQPLFMVSIVDEGGSIIDISDSFGSSIILNVHTINGVIDSSFINLNENVGIISGFLIGTDTITVSSDMFGSNESQLTPSGVPVSVEFLVPDSVHVGEPFPITIHEIDSMGVPILKKQTELVSSTGFNKINDGLISIQEVGEQQIAILAHLGGAFQKSINSFSNEINFNINSDTDNVRVGEPVIIEIESSFDNIEYFIDSPFPSEKLDKNTFSVTPNYEIENAKITITGKLDGFITLNKQLELSSKNIVELKINTKSIDGQILSPTYKIHLGNEILENIAPNNHLINPQQVVLVFPNEYSTFGAGYKLVELRDNGKLVDDNILEFYAGNDKDVTVIYDRFVKITVNDGEGGGIYSYGENVVISAPNKQKISYLIMEEFSHWEGIDKSERFVISAENDIEITAVYQDDYTILMILVLGVVIGVVIFIIKTGDSAYRYRLESMIDVILNKIKPIIKIIPLSKK